MFGLESGIQETLKYQIYAGTFSCINFQPALDKEHTVKPGHAYP